MELLIKDLKFYIFMIRKSMDLHWYIALCNLKTDGTFEASGGAADTGVYKLELYEGGYVIEEVFGSGHQDKKQDVEWHDLTEYNVEAASTKNSEQPPLWGSPFVSKVLT